MPRVAIVGAPGVGKTTLLAELSRLGHQTVSDSAREVIRARKAAGLPPRPNPLEFAHEILKRDVEKYESIVNLPGLVFFERTGLEPLAAIRRASSQGAPRPAPQQESFKFHDLVFILPPWKDIYVTDSERDHSFEHALRVHVDVAEFYTALGYQLSEVSRGTPEQRAQYVLQSLAASAA